MIRAFGRGLGRSPRRRLLSAVAVVALMAGGLVLGIGRLHAPPGPAAQPAATSPTGWELPSLTGPGQVRLVSFRGLPTVVNFFASWCTACRGELPGFADLAQRTAGRIHFVGVGSMETADGAAMARQFGVSGWPLARDVGGAQDSGLHDALGVRGMPATVFYDDSGRILATTVGAISEDDLRSRIRSLYGISVGG